MLTAPTFTEPEGYDFISPRLIYKETVLILNKEKNINMYT